MVVVKSLLLLLLLIKATIWLGAGGSGVVEGRGRAIALIVNFDDARILL